MTGIHIPDDISSVQSHLTAFRLCDLGLRETVPPVPGATHPEAPGVTLETLLGYVKLLPGALGLVSLARIGRGERDARTRRRPSPPHVADARELLTHLLPVAVWQAIARCLTLAVNSPDPDAALNALERELRPRLHRTIRCAAVVDPDAAVRLMVATSALTLAWTHSLYRRGSPPALVAGVASLTLNLDVLKMPDATQLGEAGGEFQEPILYSPRRRKGAVVYDRVGIAAREQMALRDLDACARKYSGQIEAMREILPGARYTFARLLLRQGRNHSQDLSRVAWLRRAHRPDHTAQQGPTRAVGGRAG